jgi:hypothetical protein
MLDFSTTKLIAMNMNHFSHAIQLAMHLSSTLLNHETPELKSMWFKCPIPVK